MIAITTTTTTTSSTSTSTFIATIASTTIIMTIIVPLNLYGSFTKATRVGSTRAGDTGIAGTTPKDTRACTNPLIDEIPWILTYFGDKSFGDNDLDSFCCLCWSGFPWSTHTVPFNAMACTKLSSHSSKRHSSDKTAGGWGAPRKSVSMTSSPVTASR